ncbi:MAG: TRAM domain-containing protein [Nitrososphaerales archaeon]
MCRYEFLPTIGGELTSRDNRFGGFKPKPVEEGKEYDVKIEEISRKGDGIARVQGFVIFVRGGQVGQECKIRVSQVGNRFATAEIVQ